MTRNEKMAIIEDGMNYALEQLTEARKADNADAVEYWASEAERFAEAKAEILWA